MSGHTPGPWNVAQASKSIGGGWTVQIGSLSSGIRVLELGSQEADARLIAAAPELLALTERALEGLTQGACETCGAEPGCGTDCPTCEWVKDARAAVAQARSALR